MVLLFVCSWIFGPRMVVLFGVKPKGKGNYLVQSAALPVRHFVKRLPFFRRQSKANLLFGVLVFGFLLTAHGGSPVLTFV